MRIGPITVWLNRCTSCRRIVWRAWTPNAWRHHECAHREVDRSPVGACSCGYASAIAQPFVRDALP